MKYITYLMIIINFNSFSETINWKDFDFKKLNNITKNLINKKRKTPVSFDSTCFLAAEAHGLYLVNNKVLYEDFCKPLDNTFISHLEPKNKYLNTMGQRLSYFRNKNSASFEICSYLELHKNTTYEHLANKIIHDFMQSEPHANVIKDEELKFFAISSHISEDGTVYSVIVFSKDNIVFKKQKTEVIYQIYLYKTKELINKNSQIYPKEWSNKKLLTQLLIEYETRTQLYIDNGLSVNNVLNLTYDEFVICNFIHQFIIHQEDNFVNIQEFILKDIEFRHKLYKETKKPF